MKIKENYNICKILAIVTFVVTVAVNAMASILPINGMDTGQISDSFPNLFAPAGLTFAIWGVIYILLAAYAVYYSGIFKKDKSNLEKDWLRKVGFLFVLSNVANTLWILAWHYLIIELSLILMLVILASLMSIILIIRKQKLSTSEKIFVGLPFSIYFGWITVATIANITTLLVDWNWNMFGIEEALLTIIVLAVGLAIGTATILANKDSAYGLVLIWAFAGILLKHVSASGFNGQYPGVIAAVIVSLVVFTAASGYALYLGIKVRK